MTNMDYEKMPEAHLLILTALFLARECPKRMIRNAIEELPRDGVIPLDPSEIIDEIDTAIDRAFRRSLGELPPR